MRTDDEGRAPICPFCGVTALPGDAGHVLDPSFVCENPDCEAFGEVIDSTPCAGNVAWPGSSKVPLP